MRIGNENSDASRELNEGKLLHRSILPLHRYDKLTKLNIIIELNAITFVCEHHREHVIRLTGFADSIRDDENVSTSSFCNFLLGEV